MKRITGSERVPGERLPRSFYARDALVVARALIGTFLVVTRPHDRRSGDEGGPLRIGRIVETEAYRGPKDLACHARVGITKRTKTLYGPPGHAYVYLIYGMYDCFNVVCFGEGKGHAVLVRGVEALEGVAPEMTTNGPGRLTRALGITRTHDTEDLVLGVAMSIAPRVTRPKITITARVGVAYAGAIANAPWRFFDPTSASVSRPSPRQIGLGGERSEGGGSTR